MELFLPTYLRYNHMEYKAHVCMCRRMVATSTTSTTTTTTTTTSTTTTTTTTTTTAAVVIVVFVIYGKELSYCIRSWTGDDYVGDNSDAFRSRWI